MKISKFKIYHIILVVVFILALVYLKYDQSFYRNIFYIVLIISLIVKIIYDYVKKSKTTKKFNWLKIAMTKERIYKRSALFYFATSVRVNSGISAIR